MVDLRKNYPIKVIWPEFRPGRRVPLFFDAQVDIIVSLTHYALYHAEQKMSKQTIDGNTNQAYTSHMGMIVAGLTSFAKFLRRKHITYAEVDDRLLEEYRDEEYQIVKAKRASRTEKTVKRTVNGKLRVIYDFYCWAQEIQLLLEHYIGWIADEKRPAFRIKSFLPRYRKNPEKYPNGRRIGGMNYPMCYEGVGEGARHRATHYATDAELNALRDYFRDNNDVLTAERNVLIVDIIEAVAWRQSSVHSLRASQFSTALIDQAMQTGKDKFSIVPSKQKGGYDNVYDIPLPLAIRINIFIRENRDVLLRDRGKDEDDAQDHLFIAYTTCRPLGEHRISRIIGNAFTALGAPKGSGPHSIRRKCGKEKATEFVQIRRREGRSTNPEDIVEDLKPVLGHSSSAAQAAYTHGKRDMYNMSVEHKLRDEIASLRSQMESKTVEVARLRSLLKTT